MFSEATIEVSRAALASALTLVPSNLRGEFALRILGLEADGRQEDDAPLSFPLTLEQARQLIAKVDKLTAEVLKAAVADAKDDVGVVDWSTIKRITGVTNWSHFARGRLGGLNRSLASVTNVKGSRLLNEDAGWVEDGQGDYSAGTMSVDGPAVRALQVALGVGG